MFRRLRQWFCIVRAKKPERIVLYVICMFNLFVVLVTTVIMLWIQHNRGSEANFFRQIYNTALMIIGAGDMNDVVDRSGVWDVHTIAASILYLVLIIVTLVSFTGALIGYLSNKISRFVERSNAGVHALDLSEHTVILNWNCRAAEIINNMLFKQKRERIIVMVREGKESIETEIRDRLSDTVRRENQTLRVHCAGLPFLRRRSTLYHQKFHNKLTIIVRQGDIFSAERLVDVSVGQAKSIIILGQEPARCGGAEQRESESGASAHEDCSTVKLLMQVAEITGSEESRNHQQIIVEVNNDWTMDLVQHIIKQKQKAGKSNIIAVPVNQILGDILAQIIIMPELNLVYNKLFTYRGAEFFTRPAKETDQNNFIQNYLPNHTHALPLTVMQNQHELTGYYLAMCEEDIDLTCEDDSPAYKVEFNPEYQIEKKSVMILGHNAKSFALSNSLYAFNVEWKGQRKLPVLDIVVIDDDCGPHTANPYAQCSLIRKYVKADIYDKEIICKEVNQLIDGTKDNISILILSNDSASDEAADRSVFTHLIYIQSVINEKLRKDPSFDRSRIDIIAELNNPKNADIIANYNVSYVVISNRYISKLFNHLSEKESLYYLLTDILTYDDTDEHAARSKEIYLKRVGDFFRTLPAKATARQLIRAVFEASPQDNRAIVIGYVSKDKQLTLFSGDQRGYDVHLSPNDCLVIFSNH